MELQLNDAANQFEFTLDDGTAFIEFVKQGNKMYLLHTEVPAVLRNRGIASELVRQSLQYIKENGLTLIPSCSFVANYVNNHEEWHSILGEGYQM